MFTTKYKHDIHLKWKKTYQGCCQKIYIKGALEICQTLITLFKCIGYRVVKVVWSSVLEQNLKPSVRQMKMEKNSPSSTRTAQSRNTSQQRNGSEE